MNHRDHRVALIFYSGSSLIFHMKYKTEGSQNILTNRIKVEVGKA